MSSMYIRWLIFSCDLLSLNPAVNFLSMWLSGIIAIINSYSDTASNWNILFWIFTSVNLFPPVVNSTLQVFMVFSIKFMTSSDILYILRQFIIQLCGTISYAFCCQFRPKIDFFVSSCSCWGCANQSWVVFPCLWILSVPRRAIHSLLARSKSLPLFAWLIFSTS